MEKSDDLADSSAPSVKKETQLSENSTVLTPPNMVEKTLEETSKADENGAREEEEYPHGIKLILITVALCLSVFIFSLDSTIISTAIPRITDEFKALNDIGWYASAYLFGICVPQLLFGKLYTFYSIKWIYLISIFIFELGSLVCGVAPNSSALIIGRLLAGLGGAGIFSGAVLIISKTVPLHLRASYIAAVGSMFGLASIIAPLLGGAFTDRVSWRWCFYINLPIGGVTITFIVFLYQSPSTNRATRVGWRAQLEEFDILGTLFFAPAVICLLLALQWGGTTYAWSNARIITLFVLSAVLLVAFIFVQSWKQETATVPPRIFKNRNVWGSIIFQSMLAASYFIIIYFIPVWFQAIKGVSPVKSGIMILPMVLGFVLLSFVAGAGTTGFGYSAPFLLLSSVVSTIGAGLLTTFHIDTPHSVWIGYQALYGIGLGSGMQVAFTFIQAALPPADVAIGSAVLIFAQMLSGALFVSIAQTIFTSLLTKDLTRTVPDVNPLIVRFTGATELKNVIDPQYLPRVLVVYNSAITRTWYAATALSAISIIGALAIDWSISVKAKKETPSEEDGKTEAVEAEAAIHEEVMKEDEKTAP